MVRRFHGLLESLLYLIREADWIVGSERLIGIEKELIGESEVRKEMRKRE